MSTIKANAKLQHPKGKNNLSFQAIDFMGGDFSLSYHTATGKHQTMIGGYVTIILGITVITSSLVIFSQYFNTESPIVTSSTEFSSKITEFNLYDEEMMPPLSVLLGGALIPAQLVGRYITPKIQIEMYSYNNQTRNYESRLLHEFDYAPCESLDDPKMKAVIGRVNSASSEFLGNAICPDFKGAPEKFKIERNLVNSTYITATLRIFPCSLPDQAHCASAIELSYSTIIYTHTLKLLVSSNFKQPILLSPETRNLEIDAFSKKLIAYDVRKNELRDDTEVMRGPKLKKEFATPHLVNSDSRKRNEAQTYCSSVQIAQRLLGACTEYISVAYSATGQVNKVRRNYRKVTTILGELGGFVKLITTVVFILYSYYNSRSVRNYIAKSIYNFGNQVYKKAKTENFNLKMTKLGNQVEIQEKGTSQGGIKRQKSLVDPKRYQGVIQECVKSRTSALDMINKLDFVEMLQEMMFDDHHQTLLPLLVIKLKEKKMKREEELQNKAKEGQSQRQGQGSSNPNNKLFGKKTITNVQFEEIEAPKVAKNSVETQKMGYGEAYESLLESEPASRMKQAVNQIMIENLSEFFEDSKVEFAKNGNQGGWKSNKISPLPQKMLKKQKFAKTPIPSQSEVLEVQGHEEGPRMAHRAPDRAFISIHDSIDGQESPGTGTTNLQQFVSLKKAQSKRKLRLGLNKKLKGKRSSKFGSAKKGVLKPESENNSFRNLKEGESRAVQSVRSKFAP